MLFTLVNATGNVQKIVKDARKRDELIKQGYTELNLEPKAKKQPKAAQKTDDKE